MLRFTALPTALVIDDATALVKRVDKMNSYPCRRCLKDGTPGEDMFLISYDPFLGTSPYTGPGPIFVHRSHCEQYHCPDGPVPDQQRRRLLSLRAYDGDHHMLDAVVVEGCRLQEKAAHFFRDSTVAYLHVHYAGAGCFAVRIDKVAAQD